MKPLIKQLLNEALNNIDGDWAIFKISHGSKCFITKLDINGNLQTCNYVIKYSDPSVLKFTLEEAKKLIKKNIWTDDKIGVVNKLGQQQLFDWRIKHEDKQHTKESVKTKLTNMLLEQDNILPTDETADTLNYDIYYHDRPTGNITVSPVDGSPSDDATSILNFKVVKGEKPLAVITNAITNLFTLHKTLNHIYVPINPYNRLFWEKAGATRLKDGIHVFNR